MATAKDLAGELRAYMAAVDKIINQLHNVGYEVQISAPQDWGLQLRFDPDLDPPEGSIYPLNQRRHLVRIRSTETI